jgi:hypothetical protein
MSRTKIRDVTYHIPSARIWSSALRMNGPILRSNNLSSCQIVAKPAFTLSGPRPGFTLWFLRNIGWAFETYGGFEYSIRPSKQHLEKLDLNKLNNMWPETKIGTVGSNYLAVKHASWIRQPAIASTAQRCSRELVYPTSWQNGSVTRTDEKSDVSSKV